MTDTHVNPATGTVHTLGALPMSDIMEMSGLQVLEAMIAGRLPAPPIARANNFWLAEAEPGRAVFKGLPIPDFLNPLGTIHGGWISTLIDSALSCAVHTTLAPGEAYTTTSLTVNMVRPLMPGSGEVMCEGHIVHKGSRLGTAEGKLTDSRGKLVAHGTVTCMIFPAKG